MINDPNGSFGSRYFLYVMNEKKNLSLIYVFNPVVNTKLPAIFSHQRSTTVSLETYPSILDMLFLGGERTCESEAIC